MLGRGCKNWIDFTKPWIVLDAWMQTSAAARATKLAIPNDPKLKDLSFALQSSGVTTSPDFEVSNGVKEYLGY